MSLDRSQQPPILPISNIPLPKVEKSALSNGLPVHIIHDESLEVVRIDFMFGCGSWLQDKPLISFLTSQMLKEGSAHYSSQQIAEKIDFYGASVQCSSSYHYSYITVYSLTKYVQQTLEVIADIIQNPTFPEEEFAVLLNKRRQLFLLDEEKVQVLASKKFAACIYGSNHPYGKTAVLCDFDQVSLHEILTFYHKYYTLSNCQIILSGKIENTVLQQLETCFGTQPLFNKEYITKQFQIQSAVEKKHLVPKADALQAAVRIGCSAFNSKHPDFCSMKVVSMVLGGYFGSRLMSNIREEKGYTYGINSSLVALREGGSFSISTETAVEYIDLLIAEVYKEMEKLCLEPISEEELSMVRNFMLGEAARMLDGTFSMADVYISMLANAVDISHYEKQLETIRTITPLQIQALAQKYFVKDAFYEVVAGKK
jgi:predicted Zn-dependent peptidase